MRGLILLFAIAMVMVAALQLTAPRLKLEFGPKRATGPGFLATVGSAFSEWLGEEQRRQADALGWPSYRVPMIAVGFFAVLDGFGMILDPWIGLIAAIPVAYLSWRVAALFLQSDYAKFQQAMVSGLPSLLTILRVHLDLGRTVPDALKAVLPGAPPVLRNEMERVLADMHLANDPRDGLRRLSERVNRREWRAFADTIIQSWDARLSGEALSPLQDLLVIVRDKEAAETTEKLDLVLTVAPGLALFAVAIWGVAGFLIPALTGANGVF